MPTEVCGYTNYPTFHAAMFLKNNRTQYERVNAIAKEMAEEIVTDDILANQLADMLETLVTEHYLQVDTRSEEAAKYSGLKYDCEILAYQLLTAALGEVDWRQIAEEWVNHVNEG